jgi:hypothetical protein
VQGELADEQAEPQPRVVHALLVRLAALLGHLPALENRADVDAGERRRHHPEVR